MTYKQVDRIKSKLNSFDYDIYKSPSGEHISHTNVISSAVERQAIKKLDMEHQYINALGQLARECLEIEKKLANIKDITYKLCIRYKLIEGLTNSEISVKLGYSLSHTRRIIKESMEQYHAL